MKSKTNYVNILLKFRVFFVCFFKLTPKFLSYFLLNFFRNSNSFIGYGIRYLAVNRLSKSCGEKVIIFPGVYIKNLHNLELVTIWKSGKLP